MIIVTKTFSGDGKIDISHLSPGAQKKIIARERKKIELDQKISDTSESLKASKSRAAMSLEDNAKLGAYEIKKSPIASMGSAVGGSVLGGKIARFATNTAAKMIPGIGDAGKEAIYMTGRIAGSQLAPGITEATGKAIGTVKGLTAKAAVKRKEKRLNKLVKERQSLD